MKYKFAYLAFVALMISIMAGCANGPIRRMFRGADCNVCNPPAANCGCPANGFGAPAQFGQPSGQIPVTPYGSDPYGGTFVPPAGSNELPGPSPVTRSKNPGTRVNLITKAGNAQGEPRFFVPGFPCRRAANATIEAMHPVIDVEAFTLLFRVMFMSKRIRTVFALLAISLLSAIEIDDVHAQLDSVGAPTLGKGDTYRYEFGTVIAAQGKPIKNLKVTVAVPQTWPEQSVNLIKEDVTDGIRYKFRELPGVRQIVSNPGTIAGNGSVKIVLTMDITVSKIGPPKETDSLVKPRKPNRQLRAALGNSSLIEPRDRAISKQCKTLVGEETVPWNQARLIYEWIHQEIEMIGGKPVGSVKALKEMKACRQDRINLFIAMCRNQKIPARMVWADGTEYAEFYLENPDGEGFWYPCVMNGEPKFATLDRPVVIEQKGDNFKVPEKRKKVRYVRETVDGASEVKPRVQFIRRQISKNVQRQQP